MSGLVDHELDRLRRERDEAQAERDEIFVSFQEAQAEAARLRERMKFLKAFKDHALRPRDA